MRVITGIARGAVLRTLEGETVRPTTDRMKETIFSAIHFEIPGAQILDLFAGSGQMGIEALSRGARHCVFVDNSRKSSEVEIENLKKTQLFSSARVVTMMAADYLKNVRETFDVIFMDPPYHSIDTGAIMKEAFEKVNEGGCLLCESARDEILPEDLDGAIKVKKYQQGKIKVTLYRKGNEDEYNGGVSGKL